MPCNSTMPTSSVSPHLSLHRFPLEDYQDALDLLLYQQPRLSRSSSHILLLSVGLMSTDRNIRKDQILQWKPHAVFSQTWASLWRCPRSSHQLQTFSRWSAIRVEIPSTEGPLPLAVLIEEADRLKVTIHRVSQGSGVMLMTDAEIAKWPNSPESRVWKSAYLPVPNAAWDISAMAVF